MTAPDGTRVRFEHFGAIIALQDPPALVHVDREMVRELGYSDPDIWSETREHLSAPTEVHIMLTERCPAGCPSCYVDAQVDADEPDTDYWKQVLRSLSEAGVFHVAMGGGESLLREDLYELADYCRSLGMVPNLTTSGIGMNSSHAEECRIFGQVNVSLDGLGDTYIKSRGYDGASRALRALRELRAAGVSCGINLVLNKPAWSELEETIDAAVQAGAEEIEILRFKPAGRAHDTYEEMRLDEGENRELMPRLVRLMRFYPEINIKVDCSLIPMLCAANPQVELLEAFGVIGCEAGNMLSAIRADGSAVACSFVESELCDGERLGEVWESNDELKSWRNFAPNAPAPCNACPYRGICKGGCKVVTHHLEGEWFSPDPECPRVIAHRRGEQFSPVSLQDVLGA